MGAPNLSSWSLRIRGHGDFEDFPAIPVFARRLGVVQTDGLRSPAVNLRETISLTRKLFELRDAARRAR